jgi:hypothetical protein
MNNPTIGDNFDAALLREAVRADLVAKGYDALYCYEMDNCGCCLDDLMPCVTTLHDLVDIDPSVCCYGYWHHGGAWMNPWEEDCDE